MSLSGKRILLGVTGGIAAYKSAVLLRELQKSGAEVRCIMTSSALRFLGRDTMAALTRQPVPVEVFPDDTDVTDSWTRHIHWGEWADALLIAPCTANTLAKIVHGFSDNMLTSAVLAARCPVIICPTMDGGMYQAPATQMNRKKAAEMGFTLIEPEHGYLASGLQDTGRLPESSEILDTLDKLISVKDGYLQGKKVVVTAGPTREYLDPVRFLSNPSSGRMGVAMAEAAKRAGADVTLIHGPVSIKISSELNPLPVVSALDMFEAVKQHASADVFILAAAVSDFRPVTRHSQKVKKETADSTVEFERTDDILQWLGNQKKEHQTVIGFAMETENLTEQAAEKRERKKADWMIANLLSEKDAGFESENNSVYLIGTKKAPPRNYKGSKKEVAEACLKAIFS